MGYGHRAPFPVLDDDIWAKYELGAYTGLKDAAGKVYTRNVFNRLTPKDLHLLMQAVDSPMIPALAGAMLDPLALEILETVHAPERIQLASTLPGFATKGGIGRNFHIDGGKEPSLAAFNVLFGVALTAVASVPVVAIALIAVGERPVLPRAAFGKAVALPVLAIGESRSIVLALALALVRGPLGIGLRRI